MKKLLELLTLLNAPTADELCVPPVVQDQTIGVGEPFFVMLLNVWSVPLPLVECGISDVTDRPQTAEVFKTLDALVKRVHLHQVFPRKRVVVGDRLEDSLYRLDPDANQSRAPVPV
jgi:hypothetical protein